MFSKILQHSSLRVSTLLVPRVKFVPRQIIRKSLMLPPTQYDIPIPRKLHLTYALRVYWELIPLLIVTCTSLSSMFFSIFWALKNKVDVVFTTHNRDCISRTMDLRNPSVHKIFIINQRYEPWPEMQDALDKMVMAEKRALVRLQTCSQV